MALINVGGYEELQQLKTLVSELQLTVGNLSTQLNNALLDITNRIGTIFYSSNSTHPDALLCDGSKVLKTEYLNLYNKILNTYGTSTDTEFYIPNLIKKVAWGVTSGAGGSISSGLPNITGSFVINQNCIGGGSGAISRSGSDIAYYHESAHTTIAGHINFNASGSNSIYGASSIVQPPALKLYPFIYFK